SAIDFFKTNRSLLTPTIQNDGSPPRRLRMRLLLAPVPAPVTSSRLRMCPPYRRARVTRSAWRRAVDLVAILGTGRRGCQRNPVLTRLACRAKIEGPGGGAPAPGGAGAGGGRPGCGRA